MRVFINDRAVDIPRGARVRDAVAQADDGLAKLLETGDAAYVTDAAGRVGHVGGVAGLEQLREPVVGLCDGVAHAGAAGDIDCPVVNENPHQRSVRWKRTSAGASTGARN